MRLHPNMELSAVDNPSPKHGSPRTAEGLYVRLTSEYQGVEGPPRAYFYTDGESVWPEDDEQGKLRQVVYVSYAIAAHGLGHEAELAHALYRTIVEGANRGRLVWRSPPVYETDEEGGFMRMRLAFTGETWMKSKLIVPLGMAIVRKEF